MQTIKGHSLMKNKTFWQSVKCAFAGIKAGFKSEKNFLIYIFIALVFLCFNILLHSTLAEYSVFLIAALGVFSAEFFNTAIEYICDIISPEYDEKVKIIKDIAAAGVLMFGFAFFATQAIILLPKII